MKLRVGIITHYYKSTNYGGNLQAYALCEILKKNGYDAEQICFLRENEKKSVFELLKLYGFFGFAKRGIRHLFSKFKKTFRKTSRATPFLEKRNNNISKFNNAIPHSVKIYNQYNIEIINDEYDVFITGSDQVWHPSAINCAYTLEFVKNKPKISYAASISQNSISNEMKAYFKTFLKDYKAISVREENAVKLLKDLSPVNVEWVLDPTLLLNQGEWNEVVEEVKIKEKYLFCYFLGKDKKERFLAKEFARKQGFIIVDIPHLQGFYEKADNKFADINITTASVGEFLSLIKNAEYIFTDSFHAVVFSLIFNKQFFVFERAGHKGMSERVNSLLNLFGVVDRFCDVEGKRNLNYIQNLKDLNYNNEFVDFENMIIKSVDFLLKNLGDVE